jgi:hypothetical protein
VASSPLDQLTGATGMILIASLLGAVGVVAGALALVLARRRTGSKDETPDVPQPPALAPIPSDPGNQAPVLQSAHSEEGPVAPREGLVKGPLAPLAVGNENALVPVGGLVEQPPPDPSRLRLLGLILGLLTERARTDQPPQLGTAIARLADGDHEMAHARLSTLALALMGEDQANQEKDSQLGDFLSDVLEGELASGLSFSSMPEFQQALAAVPTALRRKLDTIVWSRNADAVNMLTKEDVEVLERVAVAMATAHVIDTSYRGRIAEEEDPVSDGPEPAEQPAPTPVAEGTDLEEEGNDTEARL